MWTMIQGCLTFVLLATLAMADHYEDHNHTKHSADHHGEDESYYRLMPLNADFAFTLYDKLSKQADAKGKNIFFSPLSISMVLSMLALGAKGATHSQIFCALGYSSLTEDQVNEAYKQLLHILGHNQDSKLLEIGGGLAVRDGFKPVEKFLKDIEHVYHGEAFSVDFSKPDIAVQEVNKFIAKKTKDTITDMVKSLEPETIMVLINYIYFKGKWMKPFLPQATDKAEFYVNGNTKVTVDMMKTKEEHYNVYLSKTISLIKLPYSGNVSMVIILPNKETIEELEQRITRTMLKDWLRKTHPKSVKLSMPKFSISASISLVDTLLEMGVTEAFSDMANFSRMSEDLDLKVSQVLHKAILTIDEKGTEAAATSTVEIVQRSMPIPITINRPFLVFIVEEALKSILFMGRIINPTEQ